MFNRFFYFLYSVSYILNQGSPPTLAMLHIESLSLIVFISVRCFCSKKREFETWILKILNLVKICADKIYFILQSLLSDIIVEEKGWFWLTDPSTLDPSTLRRHVWASTEAERVLWRNDTQTSLWRCLWFDRS